jgi:hypothetical protein
MRDLLYYKSIYKSAPIFINIMNHPVGTGTAKCNMSQSRYQILAVLALCIFHLSFIISSITISSSPLFFVFLLFFLFSLSFLSLSLLFFALDHRLGFLPVYMSFFYLTNMVSHFPALFRLACGRSVGCTSLMQYANRQDLTNNTCQIK